jgi:hypothetical protein
VSGYFLLGNRKYPDSPTGNVPTLFACRDISCWAMGNVPTDKTLSGYFLLGNRKYPDSLPKQEMMEHIFIDFLGINVCQNCHYR